MFELDVANRTSRILINGRSDDVQGQLSRDGRLAYTSGEPGDLNVYVRSLADPERIERISEKAGSDPRWRQDGRELFFIDGDGRLTSAEMSPTSLRPLRVTPLFPTKLLAADSPYASGFQPNARGDRFLIRVPLNELESSPLTVTINWSHRLGARE
jgi:hypothetical protein